MALSREQKYGDMPLSCLRERAAFAKLRQCGFERGVGVNHFHFPSVRVQETIAFYEKYFGFRQARLLGSTHVLKNERNFLLAIDEAEVATPLPRSIHLGFTLSTREDVYELHKRMEEEKTPSLSEFLSPSKKAAHFYCEDPTGHRLEVGWYDFS
jgi:catechol 2,3-dioxygenase-like lactoylglutathione lyase family enzyme